MFAITAMRGTIVYRPFDAWSNKMSLTTTLLFRLLYADTIFFFLGLSLFGVVAHFHFLSDGLPAEINPTTAVGTLIAGFMAMTGLMVWIVKRNIDTVIPGMQTTFKAALDSILASQEKLNERNQKAMEQQREMHRLDIKDLSGVFSTQTTELRVTFEKKLDSIMLEARSDREKMMQVILESQATIYNKVTERAGIK
jgi:hypothetical protein